MRDTLVAACGFAAAVAVLQAQAAQQATVRPADSMQAAVTVQEAMGRVAGYIDDYAEKMSLVIGVERYAQWQQREDAPRPISKQMVAEFALVRRGPDDWDGFRNVYEVDGKPVPDAQDRIKKLFTEAPTTAIEQSRKLAAESSRHNLGAMQRNFNVPTVALFFLGKANQQRFRFAKDKDDEVGGVRVWKVRFEETQKPTIIRTSAGKDMPVKGEAWIDPADGRVLKTHVQLDSEATIAADMNAAKGDLSVTTDRERRGTRRVKTTASITVTYAVEPKFGLLVPSEMLETYEAPMRSSFTGEDVMTKINCRATYSDFKRFETSANIVPK